MIRIFIIDDSTRVAGRISRLLSVDPEFEIIGSATKPEIDPLELKNLQVDVILLDVDLLAADGIHFLQDLMHRHPLPVVLLTHREPSCAEISLQALGLGAVDIATKPAADSAPAAADLSEIVLKIKASVCAKLRCRSIAGLPAAKDVHAEMAADNLNAMIIAIGASTGGTSAIEDVLSQFPSASPGIVISQHIPGNFSSGFAERLDRHTSLKVCEAADGQLIRAGHAYLAPGGLHLKVIRRDEVYYCRLDNGPQVNRHKPSVEVMFASVAKSVGANAIAVLLTGMGKDGSIAMGQLQHAGATTIAQDQASSVVWGMPGEAVRRGHADYVLPLTEIAQKILRCVSEHR